MTSNIIVHENKSEMMQGFCRCWRCQEGRRQKIEPGLITTASRKLKPVQRFVYSLIIKKLVLSPRARGMAMQVSQEPGH